MVISLHYQNETKTLINKKEKKMNKSIQTLLDLRNQVRVIVLDTLQNHTNYGEDIFKTLPINRTIKDANVNKLVKAFQKAAPHGVSVLTVIYTSAFNDDPKDKTKYYYLCDGHHRRKAALKFSSLLGDTVPLMFNIIEIDGEDTIANVGQVLETINVNMGTWSPKDFASHITKLDLKLSADYKLFTDYCETHKFEISDMLMILGLGEFSMNQFKGKEFKVVNKKKSDAILNLFKKIGRNNPKEGIDNALPHNYIKRVLIKKLINMDIKEINDSVAKIKEFLKDEKFSYVESIFREQLEEIFAVAEEEIEEETEA